MKSGKDPLPGMWVFTKEELLRTALWLSLARFGVTLGNQQKNRKRSGPKNQPPRLVHTLAHAERPDDAKANLAFLRRQVQAAERARPWWRRLTGWSSELAGGLPRGVAFRIAEMKAAMATDEIPDNPDQAWFARILIGLRDEVRALRDGLVRLGSHSQLGLMRRRQGRPAALKRPSADRLDALADRHASVTARESQT